MTTSSFIGTLSKDKEILVLFYDLSDQDIIETSQVSIAEHLVVISLRVKSVNE